MKNIKTLIALFAVMTSGLLMAQENSRYLTTDQVSISYEKAQEDEVSEVVMLEVYVEGLSSPMGRFTCKREGNIVYLNLPNGMRPILRTPNGVKYGSRSVTGYRIETLQLSGWNN